MAEFNSYPYEDLLYYILQDTHNSDAAAGTGPYLSPLRDYARELTENESAINQEVQAEILIDEQYKISQALRNAVEDGLYMDDMMRRL